MIQPAKYRKFVVPITAALIALIIFSVISLYMYAKYDGKQYPDYSSYSTNPGGIKALYLLTGKMGYNVARFEKSARFFPQDSHMVLIKPDSIALNNNEKDYLMQKVEDGTTIILVDEGMIFDQYQTEVRDDISTTEYMVFSYGKGFIFLLQEPEKFTNSSIASVTPAVVFTTLLSTVGADKVVFNEFYNIPGKKGVSIWDLLGNTGNTVAIQIFISIAVFLVIKAHRLGKSIIVHQNIKRKENENLYALSNLFIKTKVFHMVLNIYLQRFKKQLAAFLDLHYEYTDNDLISLAATKKSLEAHNIRGIISDCNNYIEYKDKNLKRMMALIQKIEAVTREFV